MWNLKNIVYRVENSIPQGYQIKLSIKKRREKQSRGDYIGLGFKERQPIDYPKMALVRLGDALLWVHVISNKFKLWNMGICPRSVVLAIKFNSSLYIQYHIRLIASNPLPRN